jgi:hypothetical protein
MSLVNTLQLLDRARYSLQLEHPRTGAATIETFASRPPLVVRAVHAMQAGYRIGIWSPAALERRKRKSSAQSR